MNIASQTSVNLIFVKAQYACIVLTCILIPVSIIFLPATVFAADGNVGGRKMLVVIADGISFDDWSAAEMRHVRGAGKMGAIGLLVTRTLNRESSTAAYVTLGSGLLGDGNEDDTLVFNVDEIYGGRPAGTIFTTDTGVDAPEKGIVHIGWAALRNKNLDTRWGARPGALAGLLEKNGYTTAAVGNSDFYTLPRRGASIVALDEYGKAAAGNVSGNLLSRSDAFPGGAMLDTAAFRDAMLDALSKADFVVADFGDTSRAERFSLYADDKKVEAAKKAALAMLDNTFAFLLDSIDMSMTQIILISPAAHESDY